MLDKKSNIPEIVNLLDVDKLHVHAPTNAIMVCGGESDLKVEQVTSFRDAFLKGKLNSILDKYSIHLPEDAKLDVNSSFGDWLEFERYAAEVCQLVMLFCESPGSFAELGSFAVLDEISSRLIVFIDNDSYKKESYINLGPCSSIIKKHGKDRIFVIDLNRLTMVNSKDYRSIKSDQLLNLIGNHVDGWIINNAHPRTFNKNFDGHIVKLITGLIQHYGALDPVEISVLLYCLGISKTEIELQKYLDIACYVEWIKCERRGVKDFYVALQEKDAMEYALSDSAGKMTKYKWRADVRRYWMEHDKDRYSAMTANSLREAS